MKKLLLTVGIVVSALISNAQIGFNWCETFDAPSLADSVTSYTSNPPANAGWTINSRLQVTPANSDSAYVTTGDTVILATIPIDFTGMTYVILEFDQICKVDFFDVAILEVSPDGGGTWFQLTDNEYLTPFINPPGAPFGAQNNQFSAASYANWQPANGAAVPDNSWWHHEIFDISSFAGEFPNAMVRFVLYDSNIPGGNGNNGWKVDNICITAAPCELTPPVLAQTGIGWINTVYNLGPYPVGLDATDNSGIANAYLVYTINGGAPVTSPMTYLGGSSFTDTIPAVNDGDTVCYYFYAEDASACANTAYLPASGCTQFIASAGITFPYCDNLDAQNLWWDSTAFGSQWELGTPAFGYTTGALSAPNAWDVDLASGYQSSSNAQLYSPVFGTPIPNAKFSFWHKFNTENTWDGTRVEYSTDGTTWAVLGDFANSCGCQTNWYNIAALNSSFLPAWTGQSGAVFPNSTNGWVKSEYTFTAGFPFGPNIQFRFVFTSDAIIEVDGYSIDDFCFTLPQPEDAGVAQVVQPTGNAPAGTCLPVVALLQNYGINTLTNFDIYYTNNGVLHGPFPWTGSLSAGDTVSVTLPCDTILAGTNQFCVYTSMATDGNHFNDTLCNSIIGVPTLVLNGGNPYCDGFDTVNVGWFNQLNIGGNSGSIWEWGTPTYGTTNTTNSPPKCWDINLSSIYTDGADASLYTPYFDISTAINPYLKFYMNFNTEQNWDGVRMEYSINGSPWTMLNPPTGIYNWYNMPQIFSSGLPAWAGNTQPGVGQALLNPSPTGWCKVEALDLGMLGAGNPNTFVQFRFVFTSDLSVQLDGFSIDDFCFSMPPEFDAGVPQIQQPGVSAPAGSCLPVIVTIHNYGYTALTSMNVYYSVDSSGVPVIFGPYLWTGSLAPGDTTSFTAPCFNVPNGAFTLCSWTELINPQTDGNPQNDTSCVNVVGIPVLNLTSCDDMESGNIGYLTTSQSGFTNWELGAPNYGVTTGAHSGTNAWDINLTTPYQFNDNCVLTTPIYDVLVSVNPSLSFWQNRNVNQQDGMHVEYTTNGGTTWNILWPGVVPAPINVASNWYNTVDVNFTGIPGWTGSSGGWKKSTYFLKDVLIAAGNPNYIQFRFVFQSSFFNPLDGISLDDICVKQPAAQDAGVIVINTPAQGSLLTAGSNSPVNITFQNFGAAAITSCNISWALNGIPQGTPFAYTGNLLPGDISSVLTLNGTLTIPAGAFTICAYTQLIADGDTTNDTTCVDYVGVPVIPLSFGADYCDDFEGPNIGWTMFVAPTGDPGTIWELGAPTYGLTNSAHSGIQAWDINLNIPYTNSANVALYTPVFDFATGPANDVQLSFWRNHNCEQNWDGVRLEYTTNGITWNIIGGVGAPTPYINWYNSTINATGLPAWNGSSAGWVQSQMLNLGTLPGVNGASTLQFRFNFDSDFSVITDGFTIDDFCLIVPPPLTATPTSIGTNISFPCVFEGQNVSFKATIKNNGTTSMNNVKATLTVDGTTIVTDSIAYSPALPAGASQLHTFTVPWTALLPGSHTACAITSNPNGQVDLVPADDTVCFNFTVCDTIGIASGGSYCTDFEGANTWVSYNALNYTPNTSWEFGTPGQTTLNSAHSGTKAWMTNLTANYPNRDTSGLFTPVFNVTANKKYYVSFWHQYATELYQDGGTFEYTIDYGANWYVLGNAGSGPNWFNSFFITALGGTPYSPGWSGFLPAYQYAKHEICFSYDASVMFRFRFMSDYTVNDEGWVIDDFCFADSNTFCAVNINELIADNGFSLGQNYPNPADGTTTIEYTIPEKGNVELSIINLMGQVIEIPVSENKVAGRHTVTFDTNRLAPGIYYYQLRFNNEQAVKKMVVTR